MKDKNDELPRMEHAEALQASSTQAEDVATQAANPNAVTVRTQSRQQALRLWLSEHRTVVWLSIAGLIIVLGAVFGLTDARYAALNLVTKADVQVEILDASTKQPVPAASVVVGSSWAQTDSHGQASLKRVAYGNDEIKVTKFAYGDNNYVAKVTRNGQVITISLTPTGSPVSFKVTNTLTGQPLKGVKASFDSSDAVSNQQGLVAISIPPQQSENVQISLSYPGMNLVSKTVALASKAPTAVSLTPSGKVYFLSKRTGRVDVMKGNLDGTGQEIVLPGTGKEDNQQTILLASRDWKYLALKSKRDGDEKLYVIDTRNDSSRVIDGGAASFTPVGWNGHSFVFKVYRRNTQSWQPKAEALKSFNAENDSIATIDETAGEGVSNFWGRQQNFGSPYIVKSGIVYTKTWNGSMAMGDVNNEIILSKVDGSQKRVLKSLNAGTYRWINAQLYAVDEIYYQIFKNDNTQEFLEYEDGQLKDAKITNDDFIKFYATPLLSPSGNATVWSEPRDGKQTVLIGNDEGKSGKEVISLGEYVAYGWYGDDYILLSKNGSELYIMAKAGPGTNGPYKITDYHKPEFDGRGYGYGYGGF